MSQSSPADLTVVMPLFNAAEYVGAAARSVLENADGLLELIVVDDGSTDGGADVVAGIDERVRVIAQQNQGASAARNRGVREARSELIGFLDSDDIWTAATPDPRRAVLASGADVAYGRIRPVAGDPPRPYRHEMPSWVVGAMLAARELLLAHPFDDSFEHGEDIDWMLRVRDEGCRIERIEDTVIDYRLRGDGLTQSDPDSSQLGLVKALHASLRRSGRVGN